MPSKKQKRRREKGRRHEYEYVYVDDTGQEVEVEEEERPAKTPKAPGKTPGKQPAGKSTAKTKSGRPLKEPPVPSWGRAFKRAFVWQVLILVAIVFFLKSSPIQSRIAVGVVYGIAFVPFIYWMDKIARQRWLRQTGQLPPKEKKGSKR